MNTRNVILIAVVVLAIGIIGTHLGDAVYYNHQMDKEAQSTVNTEANLGLDFNNAIGLTFPKQIDCSQFRDSTNISYCKAIDQVRN